MRKLAGLLITAVVLAAIGGAYWLVFLKPASTGVLAAGSGGPPPAAVVPAAVVEATAATLGTAVRKIKVIGTIANNGVMIRPEIQGRVTKILFADGTTVQQGQPLIELDRTMLQAERDDAEAELTLAQRHFSRVGRLVQRGTNSASDRDEAEATLHKAEARATLARAKLEKATIVAPFSGTLGICQVGIGDYVIPGKDMVNLEELMPIKVTFGVPERFLSDLAIGQHITLRSTAYPDTDFDAEIAAIDPRIDKDSDSVIVQATAPNPEAKLRPGQFALVTVRIGERRGAVFVPKQTVVVEGEDRFVYRIVDGHAVRTPITTGMRTANYVEVLSGLAPGELVITAGQQKISANGMPVKTVEPASVPSRTADEEIEAEAS